MVEPDLIAGAVQTHLDLVANQIKMPLVGRHPIAHGGRDRRLDRQLERIGRALPLPDQLVEVCAAQKHGLAHITTPMDQVTEQADDVQERGLSAGIWTHQRLYRPQRLIDALQAAEMAGLDAGEHGASVSDLVMGTA